MEKIEEYAHLKDIETYTEELRGHVNELAKIAVSSDFAYVLNCSASYLLLARLEVNRVAACLRVAP